MSVVLAIIGCSLVAMGILWRLNEIQDRALADASEGAPGGNRPQKPSGKGLGKTLQAVGPKTAVAGPAQAVSAEERLRRSDRVLMKIPLEVAGNDYTGHSFSEQAHTLVINRNGACVLLRNSIKADARLTIKNLQTGQACRFRALQSGPELPDGFREWGVELLDPVPAFWRISFPEAPEDFPEEVFGSLLECTACHCREMTKLSMSDYRRMVRDHFSPRHCSWCGRETTWKFATAEENVSGAPAPTGAESPAVGANAPGVERRRDERRIARLPISIQHADGREEFTMTENVSRSGVCFAASMELAVGDRVSLRLVSDHGPGEAEFRAEVRWRRRLNDPHKILYGMKMERD